jgi:hypothetical protein
MMSLNLARFTELCEILAKLDLFGSDLKVRPKLNSPAAIKSAVTSGAAQIPLAYRDTYAAAILRELDNVLVQLKEVPSAERVMVIEQFYAAVYEHGTISGMTDVRSQLRRFLAVISNLYRSFVNDKKRSSLNVPQVTAPAPLAFFQSNGEQGPYTITSESMQKLFATPVAVVSLPATYRDHSLLWCSLAHEVCGHDVVHADSNLVPEMVAGVRNLFVGSNFQPEGALTPELINALLWPYWIDEAVADVYGVLNMGPTFALNLAAFFSALMSRAMNQAGRDVPGMPYLRCNAGPRDPMMGNLHMDEHPVDILRPYLAIGVIESLTGLSTATKEAYIADIKAVTEAAAHGTTEVHVQGQVQINHTNWRMIDEKIPLAAAQDAARKVGAYLASAKLKALNDHSIQEVETWDDVDEAAAQAAATHILANSSIIGDGDDAQLLAGANIVAFARPDLYDQLTALLHAGLDDSFERDPIWGPPKPHSILAPSVLYPFTVKEAAPRHTRANANKGGKKKAKASARATKATKAARSPKAKSPKAKAKSGKGRR